MNNMNRSNNAMSDMLDLSFMTEWSDDEGIGSDVSLENSEQSSSSSRGTLTGAESLLRAKKPVNTPVRKISVKKFVKILRRSVGTTENCRLQEVPAVSDCQFQRGRVFGVDLTEHLQQTSCVIPHILEFCCDIIEQTGVTDGVYRLSGQSSHIVTLRREFEGGKVPHGEYKNDVHAVASLLKLYFRSLPEPLLTYQLYPEFVEAGKFSVRYQVSSLRKLVERLPSTHQSTLSHLMKHLQKLATYHQVTGMTSRNLAIVWAPNLLRPQPESPDCLRDCGLQALVVEALIVYCEEIFTAEGAEPVCVTRKNFTKEVSIDQAVERAESFKPRAGAPERRMVRSISCVSNIRLHNTDRERPALFQGRGVMLRRDRSLTGETAPVRRQLPVPGAVRTRQEKCVDYHNSNYGTELRGSGVVNSDINDAELEIHQNKASSRHLTDSQDKDCEAAELKMERIRSSRSRLKERLNWFSSRSRQRLSSFGSSDNLNYLREGLVRSRDKLSSALSPVRGRMGSYQFQEQDLTDLTSINSQGSITIRVGHWQ